MPLRCPDERGRSYPSRRVPVFPTPAHAAWSIRADTATGPGSTGSIPLAARLAAHIAGPRCAGDRPTDGGVHISDKVTSPFVVPPLHLYLYFADASPSENL